MSTLSSGEVRHLIETANNVPVRLLQPPSTPSKTASAAFKSSADAKTADCYVNSSPAKAAAPPSPATPSSPSAKPTAATYPRIIALIRPLEEQGILLHRSREYLENHISGFSVLEHDRNIYGCVASNFRRPRNRRTRLPRRLPEARDGGYGEMLLDHLFQKPAPWASAACSPSPPTQANGLPNAVFRRPLPTHYPKNAASTTANGRNSQVFVRNIEP